VAASLPARTRIIGLDYSMHARWFCQMRHAALANLAFVRAHSLRLPFADGTL
jgi:hypothetical protein